MSMARVSAIACGYEDAIDLDRLRHDPLMKLAVGRCPESGEALASQSTISRLENAPRKTEAAQLCAALIDQVGTTVKPGRLEILDIDDTFCAAHGAQQLAFWNAHHDERGFASMHIYHVASGTPVAAILRPARTPKGTEVRTVIKHVTKRLRQHHYVVLAGSRGIERLGVSEFSHRAKELRHHCGAIQFDCASFAHSSACTRTTNLYRPLPSGLKTEASPSGCRTNPCRTRRGYSAG